MSAEHNHEPRCCCGPAKAYRCPACPDHGTLRGSMACGHCGAITGHREGCANR